MHEPAERLTIALCGGILAADITGFIDYVDNHAGFFGVIIAFLSYITSTILKLRKRGNIE